MLSLRLPAEAEARLTAMAKANGCTKTHFAREAILTYLSQHEDDAHVPNKLTAETLAKSERGEDRFACRKRGSVERRRTVLRRLPEQHVRPRRERLRIALLHGQLGQKRHHRCESRTRRE